MNITRKWFGTTAALSIMVPMNAHAVVERPPAPEGWLPHFESLIALGVVLMAAFIAICLNHARPKMRALGTFLAALSCFGIVLWFVGAIGTGFIENPKEFQTPMDAAKPTLLWLQVITAFIGGIVLLIIANGQQKQTEILDLPKENASDRYGSVSRTLHWTTALLFIFMIPTGIFLSMIPSDNWIRTGYVVIHKTIGIIILALVIARIIWNRRSKRPALDSSLKPMDRKLAHKAHILLYVLMIAVPITGYFMTSFHGYQSYFFTLKIPPFVSESDIYQVWGLFHKYVLQYLLYIVLGAHILGVLKHHFIDKHKSAIKRMVG